MKRKLHVITSFFFFLLLSLFVEGQVEDFCPLICNDNLFQLPIIEECPWEYALNSGVKVDVYRVEVEEPVIEPLEEDSSIVPLIEWKDSLYSQIQNPSPDSAAMNTNIQMLRKDHNRFNYASYECGAKIIAANPEAKSTSAVLSDTRDTYMLNLCSAEKWFIIELCEEMFVDTIRMANFEFFSSMFKDFRILGSDKYPTQEWFVLGEYTGDHIREIQTFELSLDPPIRWVEYLRFEMLTHYGHESYCPVSFVGVYGLTPIDDLKSNLQNWEDHKYQMQQNFKQDKNSDLTQDDLSNKNETDDSTDSKSDDSPPAEKNSTWDYVLKIARRLVETQSSHHNINNTQANSTNQTHAAINNAENCQSTSSANTLSADHSNEHHTQGTLIITPLTDLSVDGRGQEMVVVNKDPNQHKEHKESNKDSHKDVKAHKGEHREPKDHHKEHHHHNKEGTLSDATSTDSNSAPTSEPSSSDKRQKDNNRRDKDKDKDKDKGKRKVDFGPEPAPTKSGDVDHTASHNNNGHGSKNREGPEPRENVLKALANRIKTLEINQSITNDYLEEFRTRVKKDFAKAEKDRQALAKLLHDSATLAASTQTKLEDDLKRLETKITQVSVNISEEIETVRLLLQSFQIRSESDRRIDYLTVITISLICSCIIACTASKITLTLSSSSLKQKDVTPMVKREQSDESQPHLIHQASEPVITIVPKRSESVTSTNPSQRSRSSKRNLVDPRKEFQKKKDSALHRSSPGGFLTPC